jgi:endonuclease YncB( thermonuclease family)
MGLCISKTTTIDKDILDAEYKTTKLFIVPIESGKVIKVYDGDTITIASKLPYKESPVYRFKVRFRGIDSPEIKGQTQDEKYAAINSRNALSEKIFGCVIQLKNIGVDKYGRILADIYLGNEHINKWLLDSKYAVPYDGGKKKEWNTSEN